MHSTALDPDDRPLVTHREPESVCRETTSQNDVEDDAVVRGMLIRLSRNLAGRLRSRRLGRAAVTVKLRLSGFETHTRAVALPQANDDAKAIAHAALACLARLPRTKKGVPSGGAHQPPDRQAAGGQRPRDH